jgi:hypothetical protein
MPGMRLLWRPHFRWYSHFRQRTGLIKIKGPVNVSHQLILVDLHRPNVLPVDFSGCFARLAEKTTTSR